VKAPLDEFDRDKAGNIEKGIVPYMVDVLLETPDKPAKENGI